MKKKTLMAPKRMSARPSRSRGDAQIDARSYLLRDGVRFRTVPCARFKARLVNAMRNVDGIDSVLGGPKQNNGEVDEKNDIVVFGRNIYLPKPAGDAKVRGRAWLETREGEKLGRCEVMVSGNDNLCLRLRLDAPLRVRDCRLAIETCGTKNAALDPTSPISLYRRNVRFVGEVQ